MASGLRNLGRREEAKDPLAFNPREVSPDRSVTPNQVSNPGQSGGTGSQQNTDMLLQSLGNLQGTISGVMDKAKDQAITEGKIAFMQGKTEKEIADAGNSYTMQGFQTLNAASGAQKWFTQAQLDIQDSDRELDPKAYAEKLSKSRAEQLANLPEDPAVRKVYGAAFEELAPRLAGAQMKANSEWRETQSVNAFSGFLGGLSTTAEGATRAPQAGGKLSTLRVSPTVIDRPLAGSARDRDIGIRTMIGEAGGEGEVGLAAVAHVMKNRAGDSRWGGSIASVALAPKQVSAWNAGAGGIPSIRAISPDSPAYQKAAAVYDAVMEGRTVDPTGGATHYYSPKGMDLLVAQGAQSNNVPQWASSEGSKNRVRIGNHIFVGKIGGKAADIPVNGRFGLSGVEASTENQSAPGSSQSEPRDIQRLRDIANNPDSPGSQKQWASSELQKRGGKPVVGVAETERQTQLLEGSLKPETAEDREFIKTQGGGTPGGVKNGADIQVLPGADPNDVATTAGIPTEQPVRTTQVREAIMGWNGLKGPKKAAAVADAMRRQLAAGDETLFNDAGGIQILRDLGAQASDIDEVIKAKRAYDKESLNKFNSESEKVRAAVLADAKAGKYDNADAAVEHVAELHRQNMFSESDAKALARQAAELVYNFKGDGQKLNLDLQDSVANLYDGVRQGALTPRDAGEKLKALAEMHGVPQKELEAYVGHVYSLDQSRKSSLENEARALAEKAKTEQALKDRADAFLKRGTGLGTLTGQVTVGDHKVDIKQYAVKKMEAGITAQVADAVKRGEMDQNSAGAAIESMKFKALAKQNVVDDDFAAQFRGAFSGGIIGKDGKPSKDAVAGLDLYMRLVNDPDVGPEYIAQYLGPEQRMLAETAAGMYAGRMNLEEALVKAKDHLDNPLTDKNARLSRDVVFSNYVNKYTTKQVNEIMGSDSWMRSLFGNVAFSPTEAEAVRQGSAQMQNFVKSRADQYYSANPNLKPEQAVKMAAQDAAKDFVPVKGGMVYGNGDLGQRLDQVMGVEAHGKDMPAKLIDQFIARSGHDYWGDVWKDRVGITQTKMGTTGSGQAGVGTRIKEATPLGSFPFTDGYSSRYGGNTSNTPPYSVVYSPTMKSLTIQLYKDDTRTETVGKPMMIDARVLGAQYIKEQREPSIGAGIWDTVSRGVADNLYGRGAVKGWVDKTYTHEEINDPVGRMQKRNQQR